MSVQVVAGYNDTAFETVKDMFYSNFGPDDWDFIIVGAVRSEVENLAWRLEVCDSQVKQIGDQWVAVTYHS